MTIEHGQNVHSKNVHGKNVHGKNVHGKNDELFLEFNFFLFLIKMHFYVFTL